MRRRGGKKSRLKPVYQSLVDVMLCLAAILVLFNLIVMLRIALPGVRLSTPMERSPSEKISIYIECRNNRLYPIAMGEVRDRTDEELKRVAELARTTGEFDSEAFSSMLSTSRVSVGYHEIDMSQAVIGQLGILPGRQRPGYVVETHRSVGQKDWFATVLRELDVKEQILTFVVRDDSFAAFRTARVRAYYHGADVAWYLLPSDGPIVFGLDGDAPIY